jgi:hypothetical protein
MRNMFALFLNVLNAWRGVVNKLLRELVTGLAGVNPSLNSVQTHYFIEVVDS